MADLTAASHGDYRPYRLEKPDFAELAESGYTAFDMHVHTTASDGADSIKFILGRARELGIGVAITDHNRISAAVKAFRNEKGVPVIPGIEVTTSDGRHFLSYFYDIKNLVEFYTREMRKRRGRISCEELVNLKAKYDYLISVAHPNGFRFWHNLKLDFDIFHMDALEILNSKSKLKHALRSLEWALSYKKGYTGGTDAHMASDVGRIVTCSLKRNVEEFLDSIKKRETFVIGTFYPLIEKIWNYARFYPLRRIRSMFSDFFQEQRL